MDVEHLVFESLRRIVRSLDVHSRALLREHRLTGPQLSVLKELARHGQAPIGTLAKRTFLGAPTVTGVVDRLERQGWVARGPGREDRLLNGSYRRLRRNKASRSPPEQPAGNPSSGVYLPDFLR